MTKLADLLGRKSAFPDQPPAPPAQGAVDVDEDLFSALGTQMGGENEVVRNLLLDAGYKIAELEEIKATFTRLIEPVSKTLRSFEVEKAEKVALQTTLNTVRADYTTLRDQFGALEKISAAAGADCKQLREELATSTRSVKTLETANAEMAAELASARTHVADLDNRLALEAAEARHLREDGRRLNEHMVAADRRLVQMEAELTAAQQKLQLAENEKRSLHASLQKSIDEAARSSRRLQEVENVLAAAQTRLRHIETQFAEMNGERLRLSAALEEANEAHEREATAQKTRLAAMASRTAATEKILSEAREALMARAEDIRRLERQLSEISLARDTFENKLTHAENDRLSRDAQIHESEQSRAVLQDRNAALTRTAKAQDAALQRAEEKIAALAENLAATNAQMEANRQAYAREIADVNVALSREKIERAMAEGALETGRKDLARVMREVMALQRRQNAQELTPGRVSANAA